MGPLVYSLPLIPLCFNKIPNLFIIIFPTISLTVDFIQTSWLLSTCRILICSYNKRFYISLYLIFLIIIRFSNGYLFKRFLFKYFKVIIYLFYFRIVLLLFCRSYFLLFLSWEGLGLTSYFLILYYYNWNSISRRAMTLITNRIGDSLIIILLFFNKNYIFFILIIILIVLTKRAIFPFSSWLPAAIAAPTPVSALVHSRTLVTAGIYLNFKFKLAFIAVFIKRFFFPLGATTILIGSLIALTCWDIKKLIAFSTLRQLGIILLICSTLRQTILLFYLLIHAFIKRIIFIIRGFIINTSSSQNLINLKTFTKFKNFTLFIFILLNFISFNFLVFYFSKEVLILKVRLSLKRLVWIINYLVITATLLYRIRFFLFIYSFKNSFKLKILKTVKLTIIFVSFNLVFLITKANLILFFTHKVNFNKVFLKLLIVILLMLFLYHNFFFKKTLLSLNIFISLIANKKPLDERSFISFLTINYFSSKLSALNLNRAIIVVLISVFYTLL